MQKQSASFIKRYLLFFLLFFLFSCTKKEKLISVDPAFSKYIEAYTSGVISKKSTIRIQLAADAGTTHSINETLKEEMFKFEPSVKGTAYWVDARTIEFKPAADLKPNALYTISFNLGKVMQVPTRFKEFAFNVHTIKPAFQVEQFGLKSSGNSKDEMLLTGEIKTADVQLLAFTYKKLHWKFFA